MQKSFGNYIAGDWVAALSGCTFENRNPADTSDLVGVFADSGPEDVERAVRAAREAFPGWKALPAPRRGEILFRAAEALVRRKEDLARDMTREMGKVLDETRGYVQKVNRLLGSGFAPAPPPSDAASFFVPSGAVRPPPTRATARARRPEPARPRVYYKWRDTGGITHVAEAPPPEGTVYSMIRALD